MSTDRPYGPAGGVRRRGRIGAVPACGRASWGAREALAWRDPDMGRAYRLHPDHGGAHGVLRHPGVLLLRGRLLPSSTCCKQHRNARGHARLAVTSCPACGPAARARCCSGRGSSAVFNSVRGDSRPEEPAQAGFHGRLSCRSWCWRRSWACCCSRESNMPFTATPQKYFNADGSLTSAWLSMLGMNALLEHWAMAIHPPTLFVGYAGLTIPFAYAIAALIVNDSSREWVVRCHALRPVLVAVPGHRHRPWRRVGLRGARLGRLLGLGRRGKRQLAVVAGGRGAHPQLHRVPPARSV